MDLSQLYVSILVILIGGGILGYAGLILVRESRRKDWSRTTGEIIASEINTVDGEDGPIYYPAVRYRYKVNLVEYESGAITTSVPPSIGMQGYAKAMVNKYQLHNKVDIYYNPDNPQEAVLDRNVSSSGMFLLIILGIPVLLCGLLLLLGFLVQAGILEGFDY